MEDIYKYAKEYDELYRVGISVDMEQKECRDEDLNDHIQRIVTPELFEDEDEEEEEEWEYCNCGIEKEPRFGEMSYMVAGGGMMNGNAYATIELKDGLYYYCEYGNYPKRQSVGNEIVWSDEIYDKQNPYCSRNFNILDVVE